MRDRNDEWRCVTSSLMIHVSGFVVLSLTAQSDDHSTIDGLAGWTARQERALWEPTQRQWRFASGSESIDFTASVRGCLNFLFLLVHESLGGRSTPLGELINFVNDGPLGNDHLMALCRQQEISYPFPVSFGTHVEVIDVSLYEGENARSDFLRQAMRRAHLSSTMAYAGRVPGRRERPWFFLENQSVVFSPRDPDPRELADRIHVIQFVTLRRAAMRSVQRDTQRILSGGLSVSRRRIDEWRLILATTNDKYVLHDRISEYIRPLYLHMSESEGMRDPAELEDQVRRNIDSFQSRLDSASQNVSTVVGALFAVVAAVIGLGSATKILASQALGVPRRDFDELRPWLSIVIDVGVMALAFAVTWYFIRRAGERLAARHPYSRLS